MTRHVHEGRQVAHLWANKAQESARNNNGQFYFDGDTIYSYGAHFPIARHVTLRDGSAAVLFTTRGYSVTTSKHISFVRNALRGNTRLIRVRDVTQAPAHSWADMRRDIARQLREIATIPARRHGQKRKAMAEYAQAIDRANDLHSAFGVGEALIAPADMEAAIAETREAMAKEAAENEARAKKLAASLKRKNARQFKEWIAGADVAFPSGYGDRVYLRVQGEEVVTSKGAHVPLRDAWRVLDAARGCRNMGVEWVPPASIAVGSFRLDRIDADGTTHIGCHTLQYAEMERCAATVKREE